MIKWLISLIKWQYVYHIETAQSSVQLQDAVNDHMAEGWKLQGGMSSSHVYQNQYPAGVIHEYTQALKKRK